MKQSEKDSNGVKWITVYVLHTLQQIQTECKGMKRMAVTPKNMLITRQMIFPNQVRSSNAAGF